MARSNLALVPKPTLSITAADAMVSFILIGHDKARLEAIEGLLDDPEGTEEIGQALHDIEIKTSHLRAFADQLVTASLVSLNEAPPAPADQVIHWTADGRFMIGDAIIEPHLDNAEDTDIGVEFFDADGMNHALVILH